MTKRQLSGVCAGMVLALAVSAVCASAASTNRRLELKAEGKALTAGAEVLLVGGYSLGECYWEEQSFSVSVNNSRTDKLARTGEAGQLESCGGGAKSIEITSASRMTVKLAPMRIHPEGGCVYEFKELSATFSPRESGPEIYGTATGKLNRALSVKSSACAKTRTTIYDVALNGVETALVG